MTDTYKQIEKFKSVKDELHLRPIAEAVAITIRNRINLNEAEQLEKERGNQHPPVTSRTGAGFKKSAAYGAGKAAATRVAAATAVAAAAAAATATEAAKDNDEFEMMSD